MSIQTFEATRHWTGWTNILTPAIMQFKRFAQTLLCKFTSPTKGSKAFYTLITKHVTVQNWRSAALAVSLYEDQKGTQFVSL